MAVTSDLDRGFLSPSARTAHSVPYWEGLAKGRLVLQQCDDCGAITHPPGPVCTSCQSAKRSYVEASGRGTIYTFTVMHRAMHPEFEPYLPYVVAYVTLEEGINLATWIVDVDPADVAIGMPVELTIERIDDDTTLHRFRPVPER